VIVIKRFILCLLLATTIALSGCLPLDPLANIAILTPTPSPSPVMDDATLLSIALADISENQVQYSGNASSPLTDRYLIEELNKLLLKRVYKEAFDSKIEVINAVWLIPNDNPDKEDLLLIIDCNGQQVDCTIRKTVSETILFLQWLPVGKGSSVHPESTTSDGRFWAFPIKTRNVFFYICNIKNRQGFAKVTGDNMNDYINGLLPGESIATLIHIEELP
jgi:hypothetical protein